MRKSARNTSARMLSRPWNQKRERRATLGLEDDLLRLPHLHGNAPLRGRAIGPLLAARIADSFRSAPGTPLTSTTCSTVPSSLTSTFIATVPASRS